MKFETQAIFELRATKAASRPNPTGERGLRPISVSRVVEDAGGRQIPVSGSQPDCKQVARERCLDVVIQREFVGVRTQPHGIHLVLPLIANPALDQIGRKNVSLEQEVMVRFQGIQYLGQSAR